jgi:hypothetical protein
MRSADGLASPRLMSSRLYLKIFLAIGVLPVAVLVAVNFLVDPYEVFQTRLLPEVGATQERYLKVEFLKRHAEFDVFLLGGSRMGTTVPADVEKLLPGRRAYNFFVSSGNQYDNLVHAKWLLRSRPDVKALYVQVDWPESFGPFGPHLQYLSHPEVLGKPSAGFLRQYLFSFAYQPLEFKVLNNTVKRGEFQLPLEAGYFRYPKRDASIDADCKSYVGQRPEFSERVQESRRSPAQERLIDESLGALAELVAEARKRSVEVHAFVTPYNNKFLDKLNLDQYSELLGRLASITPYWNFGFYSPITEDNCNYYETSHYRAKVSPLLFSAMSGRAGKVTYGRYVSAENVSSEIEFLRGNFRAHRMAAGN